MRALDEAFERWDGKGLPAGLKGERVSIAARIVSLAELAASSSGAAWPKTPR